VNGTPYSVPAGDDSALCVLAGQFPLNSNVTIQETIPRGIVVAQIEVRPDGRVVSKNVSLGEEESEAAFDFQPMKIGDLCPECSEAAAVNEEGCPGSVRPECYTCGHSEC
jgi:hypothetical protein